MKHFQGKHQTGWAVKDSEGRFQEVYTDPVSEVGLKLAEDDKLVMVEIKEVKGDIQFRCAKCHDSVCDECRGKDL